MPNDNFQILYKFFLDEFELDLLIDKRKPIDIREAILLQIFNRLNDISSIIDRLNRYDIYFDNFYPPEDNLISEAEVLEYHLHSYLQDFYSLREKINRLLGLIKNSVKHFEVGNPEDVDKLIDHLITQVGRGMEKVTNLRATHVHDMSIRDSEISRAKILKNLTALEGLDQKALKEKYDVIIAESKQKYIDQAASNREQLNGMKNFIAPRLGHLIAFLYQKDVSIFTKLVTP